MRKLLLLTAGLILLLSCNKTQDNDDNLLKHVSLGVSALDMSEFPVLTKSEIVNDGGVFKFRWSASDVVGMFPDKGAPAFFEMTSQEGTDVANFDGGGWALKSANKYSVYFPYDYSVRDLKNIPFDYQGQAQTGKNNFSHLEDYQFLASGASTPQDGACNYSMDRIEAVVRFRLTLPVVGEYNKLMFKLDDGTPVVVRTKLDVSETSYSITPIQTLNKFSLELNSITTTTPNEVVDFYAMLPPQNYLGKKLIICVNTSEGDACLGDVDGKNMLHNHAYQYEATLSSDYGSLYEHFMGEDGNW